MKNTIRHISKPIEPTNEQSQIPEDVLIKSAAEYNKAVYGVCSTTIPKKFYPDLNSKQRHEKLGQEFNAWLN